MEVLNTLDKLKVEGLTKYFGAAKVFENLSFNVRSGEFLSILGPSGCGKTTILRILIGLERADCGSILLDGTEISSLPPNKRKMGMVFQNYALFENMTVQSNVSYVLRKNGHSRAEANQKAIELLTQLGLSAQLNSRPADLSGGQQQRVAIARTLALGPEIILFDEPMSALDADTRLMLRAELKEVQKQFGTTMIYITHDQEEAFALSDRIIIMRDGEIHQLDTPESIISAPADEYVVSFVISNLLKKAESLQKYVGTYHEDR